MNLDISQFIQVKSSSSNYSWLKSGFLLSLKHRFDILHFPNSTGLFTNPTSRHYTKYRSSPGIVPNELLRIRHEILTDACAIMIEDPTKKKVQQTP